jgi:hypothetical protein
MRTPGRRTAGWFVEGEKGGTPGMGGGVLQVTIRGDRLKGLMACSSGTARNLSALPPCSSGVPAAIGAADFDSIDGGDHSPVGPV